MNSADELFAVALLADPVRSRLYSYLRDAREFVGREEAARGTGISVKLAAFHLDRMADAGLLEVDYRRLTGRSGPGAGRPAKVYRTSTTRFSVSFPETRYAFAASMMATALTEQHGATDGLTAAREVAAGVGRRIGREIRGEARSKSGRRAALQARLAQLGFEPRDNGSREVVLCNCIFGELSQSHRALVCGMNSALIDGMVEGAGLSSLHVEGRPAPPGCCVGIVGR